jgi:hypothetical protein
MAVSYSVRALSPSEAAVGAQAWNDLADGTLSSEMVARVRTLLESTGTDEFAAFVAETGGELCGIATARVIRDVLVGDRGDIEALMIDARLPDEAGDALAHCAIDWLRERGVGSISHARAADAPGNAFWERLGFRCDRVIYSLPVENLNAHRHPSSDR